MIGETAQQSALPFGAGDLDPQVHCFSQFPRTVRCYVRGCRHVLRTPTFHEEGEPCPEHGIRCHFSSYGATYSYADAPTMPSSLRTCWRRGSSATPSSWKSITIPRCKS